MLKKQIVIFSIFATLLDGCAIHPLSENTTGLKTYLIVERVRCEARDAIFNMALGYLSTNYQDRQDILDLVDNFKNNTSNDWPKKRLTSKLFSGGLHDVFAKYEKAAIAYNFSLEMQEVNNLDASLDFGKVYKSVTGGLGFGAGLDRTRDNIRTFTITDTFGGLLTEVKEDYCTNAKPYQEPNYIYPIAGSVGLREIIENFINLTEFTHLTAGDASRPAGPPTVVDTLTFTTKVSGSAKPSVTIASLPGAEWRLADASITGAVSRQDTHKLIVGLSLPAPAKPAANAPTTSAAGLIDVKADATATEQQAAHAIEQYIIRFEIGRANIVVSP